MISISAKRKTVYVVKGINGNKNYFNRKAAIRRFLIERLMKRFEHPTDLFDSAGNLLGTPQQGNSWPFYGKKYYERAFDFEKVFTRWYKRFGTNLKLEVKKENETIKETFIFL